MKRIMLNTNVFCRPFDDQSDFKLKEESDSVLIILSKVTGRAEIVTSDVLYDEVDLIKDKSKRESVLYLIESVESERITTNISVIGIADGLHGLIHDYNDCLHIAFAGAGKCDFLITCDDELLKIRAKIERFLLSRNVITKVIHPSEY